MRPNWALVLCVGAHALLAEVAFSRSGSAIIEGTGATTALCPALKVQAQTAEGTRGLPLMWFGTFTEPSRWCVPNTHHLYA